MSMQCPRALQLWLVNQDSLTERLVAQSRGKFRVGVVAQYRARPLHSEYALLRMKRPTYCFIREVVLYGNNEPWVFARSVIPLKTMTGRLRALGGLNNRPLGAFLFSIPSMQRGDIEFANIKPEHQLVPNYLLTQSESLWGRRSVFFLDQKPVLVNEIFLPAFLKQIEENQQ